MNHASLFSGIGGFDLAADWMGWKNIFQVEIDEYCQKILTRHFPKVERYGDIKTFDGRKYHAAVDIISGGFPCQPYSLAGKRKKEEDPRALWPEMFRVIREIQPTWIVAENVPGIQGVSLRNILTSLEGEGYKSQVFNIPNASNGTWDRRYRIWIIANLDRLRCNDEQKEPGQSLQNEVGNDKIEEQGRNEQQCGSVQSDFVPADITGKGIRQLSIQQRRQNTPGNTDINGKVKKHPDIDSINRGEQQQFKGSKRKGTRNQRGGSISDTYQSSLQGYAWHELTEGQKEAIRRGGQANWERNWIEVASQLCGSNARVPNRVDRIKSLGNAVNPYMALTMFTMIDNVITNSCL